jgi:predicted nucleic acid-binding protein
MTSGPTLDAGALLALERADERVRALLRRAIQQGWELHIVAGVVARTWRGGPRQARLARLLAASEVSVPPLDEVMARAVGVLCGRSGHADIVDVHVALHAREHGHAVVTSDPNDIALVDPSLTVITV